MMNKSITRVRRTRDYIRHGHFFQSPAVIFQQRVSQTGSVFIFFSLPVCCTDLPRLLQDEAFYSSKPVTRKYEILCVHNALTNYSKGQLTDSKRFSRSY